MFTTALVNLSDSVEDSAACTVVAQWKAVPGCDLLGPAEHLGWRAG
jgi:hypothetical protein